MRFSCGSIHFTSLKFSIIRALLSSAFEPIAKTSHMEENVLYKVPGNVRMIFIKTVLDWLAKFMSLCHPYIYVLSACVKVTRISNFSWF